jgi:hypothetical protein
MYRQSGDFPIEKENPSRSQPVNTGHEVEQRRLSGSVRTENGVTFTGLYGK